MSSQRNNKRLILLDTHAILHRAYHALPDFTSGSGEPTGALYGLSTMLFKIINDFSPDYLIAAYDVAEPTYRHKVYEDYKAGRPKIGEELVSQIETSKELLSAFNIDIYEKSGFEADDVLATIVNSLEGRENLEIIIASGDMDTLQLVDDKRVMVYTLKKGVKETVLYDEEAVKERFGFRPEFLPDYKGLCGDASDNILGVSGIGEKSAKELIRKVGSVEEIYEKLKESEESLKQAGISERILNKLRDQGEEAEFSKALGTTRSDVPIDFSLPEKDWRDSVDIEKVKEIFDRFDFRSLYERLETAIGEQSAERITEKDVDERELKETSVALWLLDSTITAPGLEEIIRFSGKKDLAGAKEYILERIEEEGLSELFSKIERPLIGIVEKMENRGVKIDKKYLEELSGRYHKELSELENSIWKYAGEEFNINSPQQLGEVLFNKMGLKAKNQKKTGTGMKSTKESELEKMKGDHPIIEEILKYRELQKLLSTYVDNIPGMLDEENRLHADFLQAGTTTGRMSSRNPNLQNIPIRTERGRNIRKAFTATSGFEIVSLDYSQIELRVAAFLSDDQKLLNIFKNGEDAHTAVAAEVFDISKEEVTKEMRRQAKVINFGILYGMGVNSLKQNLATSRQEAQQYLNEYFNKFEGLSDYIEDIKRRAHDEGYTETYFGRRRYIEGINSSVSYIRSAAERMAINAPIQGASADIIKKVMVKADEFLSKEGFQENAHLILQVHDELVYEISRDKQKEITENIKNIMEGVLPPEQTGGLKFKVDIETGPNWGELK